MNRMTSITPSRTLAIVAALALVGACSDQPPLAPEGMPGAQAQVAPPAQAIATRQAVATLQRVTARYHDLQVAMDEGFVLLHPCENRPDEGPVGIVYVNFDRLKDGIADPSSPDALVYEPGRNGRPQLVGVEFAIPYDLWTAPQPPEFLGARFQREDEFGVYGLHVWVWRNNPNGLFEEANPRVSCGEIE